ncbi:MAG: metal-dependent hydrolase [Pikeienuella sp.]
MFIAHIPAGYLLANRLSRNHPDRAALIAIGLVAAVFPDTDLFWFYLVDGRQTAHHAYLFHWPLFWTALAALALAAARLAHWRRAGRFILVALIGLMSHMALDSVAAAIPWLAPFSAREFGLFEVSPRPGWWVWTFVLHWSFALELAILLAACATLWRERARRNGYSRPAREIRRTPCQRKK